MAALQLKNIVGEKIFVCTSIVELEKQRVGGRAAAATLRGVEPGGIWVEHDGLAKDMSKEFGVRLSDLPKATAQIFLPYSSLLFAVSLTPKGEGRGPVH
jgi:hypothetical protein